MGTPPGLLSANFMDPDGSRETSSVEALVPLTRTPPAANRVTLPDGSVTTLAPMVSATVVTSASR